MAQTASEAETAAEAEAKEAADKAYDLWLAQEYGEDGASGQDAGKISFGLW